MQSLRRSSHFPSVFTLIFPFPMLTLPLLLAHFKLSHVGGCQTGAPQCGVSLIRTDRHQRESAACVCGLRSRRRRRLIFIFIFSPPEFLSRDFREETRLSPPRCLRCESSFTFPTADFSPSLAVSAGQPERRHGHSVHTERAGEQLLRGLRRAQYVSSLDETSDFSH